MSVIALVLVLGLVSVLMSVLVSVMELVVLFLNCVSARLSHSATWSYRLGSGSGSGLRLGVKG